MVSEGKILVIGDMMLDTYIYGKANRLSPEAPCPVLDSCNEPIYKLGGASNVAYQIAQSGFDVCMLGVVGNDTAGNIIKQLLSESNINDYLIVSKATTTTKTRYLAGNHQQLLRVDCDSNYTPSREDADHVIKILKENQFSCVVISDYGKGVVTSEIANLVIAECNQQSIPTVVDVKNDVRSKYYRASVIKGNRSEFDTLFNILGIDANDTIESKLIQVSKHLNAKNVVMTCGERGICAYSIEEGFVQFNADSIPVHDVTGAGDVVTAFLAMLVNDKSNTFSQKIKYSNLAAHKKVGQVGTGRVTLDDVLSESKVKSPEFVKRITKGKKMVFTNGCFDIIHAGHIKLLQEAKEKGDILVVGLNSDNSVKRLKGDNRPVNAFDSRAEVLSALSCVDYVIKFEEDTPLALIQELNPSVLVKGGDYVAQEVVGYNEVTQRGGDVIIVPIEYNQSSTNILKSLGYE